VKVEDPAQREDDDQGKRALILLIAFKVVHYFVLWFWLVQYWKRIIML
jgi:hypothetical protein